MTDPRHSGVCRDAAIAIDPPATAVTAIAIASISLHRIVSNYRAPGHRRAREHLVATDTIGSVQPVAGVVEIEAAYGRVATTSSLTPPDHIRFDPPVHRRSRLPHRRPRDNLARPQRPRLALERPRRTAATRSGEAVAPGLEVDRQQDQSL